MSEYIIFILIMLVIILVIQICATYNQFIKRKNNVKQAESTIDVYLTQRFDLIPNLVECVKGYMEHEKSTFERIAGLRARFYEDKDLKVGESLNNECNKILAIGENYPELKANENFLDLQNKLAKMENQLQAARRVYNTEVKQYNNLVIMFPSMIMAKIFGFKELEFFQAEEEAKKSIQIDLNK